MCVCEHRMCLHVFYSENLQNFSCFVQRILQFKVIVLSQYKFALMGFFLVALIMLFCFAVMSCLCLRFWDSLLKNIFFFAEIISLFSLQRNLRELQKFKSFYSCNHRMCVFFVVLLLILEVFFFNDFIAFGFVLTLEFGRRKLEKKIFFFLDNKNKTSRKLLNKRCLVNKCSLI